jgi:hypothetical protein
VPHRAKMQPAPAQRVLQCDLKWPICSRYVS